MKMNLKKLFGKDVNALPDVTDGFLPSREFSFALAYEKSRADRHLIPFTLVVFDVQPSNDLATRTHIMKKLALDITDISRTSDVKGWYRYKNELKIGVILFNTTAENANRLVEKVGQKFNNILANSSQTIQKTYSLQYDIWSYPSELEIPEDIEKEEVHQPTNISHFEQNIVSCKIPFWKRTIDVLASSFGLLICLPIFIIVPLIIKLGSKGPVFFKQTRIGYMGRPFKMYKFRTMHTNIDTKQHEQHLSNLIKRDDESEDESSAMKKIDHQLGIIPLGKYIRKSSIDELPQLINVFKGDMSLIGPRPGIPYEIRQYDHWHTKRLDIIPGMTGLWQVNGKNNTTFKQMVRYDINYGRKQTVWMDIKILFLTPFIILNDVMEIFKQRPAEDKSK